MVMTSASCALITIIITIITIMCGCTGVGKGGGAFVDDGVAHTAARRLRDLGREMKERKRRTKERNTVSGQKKEG
jgi:hypothetical protein